MWPYLSSFCSVPPTIVTEPSDRTVLENQQVTFHCSATGNPTPVITWIRGSETLIQGDTLTFKVNRNHSGKYWCSAENALNITVNASANLNVLCKYQNIVYHFFCCPCTPNNVILVHLGWQTWRVVSSWLGLSSLVLYCSQVQEDGPEVILIGWSCLSAPSGQ